MRFAMWLIADKVTPKAEAASVMVKPSVSTATSMRSLDVKLWVRKSAAQSARSIEVVVISLLRFRVVPPKGWNRHGMYAQTASAYNFTLASLIVKLDVLSKFFLVACWKILLVQDQLSFTLTHRIAHFCVHPCGNQKLIQKVFPLANQRGQYCRIFT